MHQHAVVVGVDGSPASYTALRWALAHARPGTRIRAVRCWDPIRVKGWEAAVTAEPVPPPSGQQARAERELADVVAAALARIPGWPTGVTVQRRVARGTAGPVLVAAASGADLLVVGHSHRYLTGMLHRSVSWYCARHATCPVLVIPPAMATRRTVIQATAELPS